MVDEKIKANTKIDNGDDKSKTPNFSEEQIKEDVETLGVNKTTDEKKKKIIRYIIYFGIIAIITGLVLGFSLSGDSSKAKYFNAEGNIVAYYKVYETIPEVFSKMFVPNEPYMYFFFGFLATILVLYCLNGFNLYLYARLYTRKYSFGKGLINHIIGVFYNNITPGASGGQFAQALTFKKQGIPLSTSASILVMIFIVNQSVLVLCGIISLFKINDLLSIKAVEFNFASGWSFSLPISLLIVIGFILNVSVILLLFVMAYSRKLHNFILDKVIGFLGKIRLIKKPDEKRESLRISVENFRVELRRLQSNIPFTILVVIIAFTINYIVDSLPCICGYALGGFAEADYNFSSFMANTWSSFCYMNFHQMTTGLIPIPGSAGISEYVFNKIFTVTSEANVTQVVDGVSTITHVITYGYFTNPDFGTEGLNLLMLLWRLGTFYIPFFVSGIVAATYKGESAPTKEKLYDVNNSRKTFLTIQMETYDERKMSSDLSYDNRVFKTKTSVIDIVNDIKNKKDEGDKK